MSSIGNPSNDSMRYMIGGEGDSGPKLVGTAEPATKAKKNKAKKAEQVRLGNFTKMITVSLRKSADAVVQDGEFVQIVKRGAQEIINAINRTSDAQLKDKYLKQFATCNKLLLNLQKKLNLLMKQLPKQDKARRSEVLEVSEVVESILSQFKKEKKKGATEMTDEVIGIMASFLPNDERAGALDHLLEHFSREERSDKAKKRAIIEMEKDEKREKEVADTLREALRSQGTPFIFPEALKAKSGLVTKLDLSSLNVSLTDQALREIFLHMPQLTELNLSGGPLPKDIGELIGMLKDLQHLYLNHTDINDHELTIIAKGGSLRTLSLSGCPMITHLEFLKPCSKLEYLDLNDCGHISSLEPLVHSSSESSWLS